MLKDILPRPLRRIALAVIACVACSSSARVVTENADPAAISHFKTFDLSAPTPDASQVLVAGTNDNDRAGGAVMDMDPMLATSLVGRAMRQDIANALTKRGYQSASGTPDFHVAYYAGTGRVVDTRGAEKSYRVGKKITTETYEYPAGTIVIDVVNAKSDSLVWRGIGAAEIPKDPEDYAKAVRTTVDKILEQFPKAT